MKKVLQLVFVALSTLFFVACGAGDNSGGGDDNQTNLKRIFILGSSTVHAGWWHSTTHIHIPSGPDPYGSNRSLEGWGEELDKYMKDPSKVYNRARSGSHSASYRTPDDRGPGITNRHWNNTEALITSTNDNNGGFLLIQFGANDAIPRANPHVSAEDFKNNLRGYIDDAKRLGLTPVLISPPGTRSHGDDTRPYAKYVEEIAGSDEEDVLFLDLYKRSKEEWALPKYDGTQIQEADKLFSYIEQYRGINHTHLGRNGAKIVAGWLRDIACDTEAHSDRSQSIQDNAALLCSQFVQGELVHNITIREDAEDGDTAYWEPYATEGTIENVYDTEKRSNIIVLHGDAGLDNGFRFSRTNLWEEENHKVISWEMKYTQDFTFFVAVDTEDGYKTFEYKPNDNAPTIAPNKYRFGLGADAMDGTWHTFTRDLEADLQKLAPGNHITKIHRIAIRGAGMVDNIRTMASVDAISRDIAPVVATVGEAEITVNKDNDYVDAGVTVIDDNDADIATHLVTEGEVDTSAVGTYIIDYKVHDSVGNGGYARRVVHVSEAGVTVHEDAEDGNTDGWGRFDNRTGSITNVADHDGRVIELKGDNGLDNGFSYAVTINTGFMASWRLKYTDNFRFFVEIRGTDAPNDTIYMEYTPDDISKGESGNFIHNGLGTDANDGIWHTFTRDIEADYKAIHPGESILSIRGFHMRGSGRIDDISTSARAPKETFAYNGHTYKIVKTALSWQDASAASQPNGGYLANIGSIAENHEIYSRLTKYIAASEYGETNTTLSNGGEASYVWIGANDMATEGEWVWENNAQQFWQGIRDGSSIGGLYSNWGRSTEEIQKEPDNASGNQNAAAIALTEWKIGVGHLGQPSQWNDLRDDTELYYIIEYDQ